MNSDKYQAQHDRIEEKLDRIDSRQDRMEIQMVKNTMSLEIHMKRTDALEKAIEPALTHMAFIEYTRKWIKILFKVAIGLTGGLTTLIGLLKALGKL